jgi:GntR family transcriptional regulator
LSRLQRHARRQELPGSTDGAAKRALTEASVPLIAAPDDGHVSIASWLRIRGDTAKPIYQQLEEQLVKLIEDGRIQSGTTLPAERQLAEVMGISRATVQRCYNTLRERQLIRAYGRNGSIVEGEGVRLLPGMDRLKGFTQEMQEMGRTPSSKIVEREIVEDRQIASIFNLPSTTPLLKLIRIRYGDDIPLSYEKAWYSLNAARFLAQADVTGSIYETLAQGGVALAYCDQTIEATLPNALESEIFGFEHPLPSLLIKRRSYNRRDVMVEYVEGLFRGDAYTYRLRLDI